MLENKEDDVYYFSMNVPSWFMNKESLKEKCDIVKEIITDLKDEPPINQQQKEALFSAK